MRILLFSFIISVFVFSSCQRSSENSADANSEPKAFSVIDYNQFLAGKAIISVFGQLYPEDANYTRDEVLADEFDLMSIDKFASRDGDLLIVGTLQFQNEKVNEYWYQGATSTGLSVVLNKYLSEDAVPHSRIILINSGDNADIQYPSESFELIETDRVYDLGNKQIIQKFSKPIPGQANGGIKVLTVSEDNRAVRTFYKVDFENKRPDDLRTLDDNTLLVQLGLDDTGEASPEYIKIEIINNYLEIVGSDIGVRSVPSTGEVVMKLNDGDECEILEKGKYEEIREKKDYWYRIKFNGKTGWVHGSQTSARQN